jgi:hypothetical protein
LAGRVLGYGTGSPFLRGKKIPLLDPLPHRTSMRSKMDRHRRQAENWKLFLHID